MSDDEDRPAITASCPDCGAMLFASATDLEGVGKEVADCIKEGLVVNTMPASAVRASRWGHDAGCPRAPKVKAVQPTLGGLK